MTVPSVTGPDPSVPPLPPVRRLLRSTADRMLGGVCGGLGRHFGIDPVLLRIAAVVLALTTGVGALAYVIAWIAIPGDDGKPPPEPSRPMSRAMSWYLGLALAVLGVLVVLRVTLPWLAAGLLWPC